MNLRMVKQLGIGGAVASLVFCAACAMNTVQASAGQKATPVPPPKKMEGKTLYVAGGCFWCVEAQFEELKGVLDVESGYANGNSKNISYEDVCTGRTGAAEAVKITFDPKVVSEDDLLRIFFVAHDPTTLNRQGPDEGTQYRSAIFFQNPEEKALAEKIVKEITDEKLYPNKIVTTIEPLNAYVRAEEYHQDYYAKFEKATDEERSRMNAGYCSFVVSPKVNKFREHYKDKLKKG